MQAANIKSFTYVKIGAEFLLIYFKRDKRQFMTKVLYLY